MDKLYLNVFDKIYGTKHIINSLIESYNIIIQAQYTCVPAKWIYQFIIALINKCFFFLTVIYKYIFFKLIF